MNILPQNLNQKQQEAVRTTEGPVLILAGPGSGKTATITARIASLIQNGIAPERILAVTFTNKAAEEMAHRVREYTASGQTPFIGTFHALCVRILRERARAIGYRPHFSILDQDDSLALVKESMKEGGVNQKQFPVGLIAHTISNLKGELITPDAYAEEHGVSNLFPKTIHAVYALYQKRLFESNAMDFDDLLMNTVLLFRRHPHILAPYQERFQYIHVDEYQDTNHAQYLLMNSLAARHRNLAVVGDDAQAIYAFRGADFRNILNFEKDWPDAKIIILDQNYRSTQVILDAAREVISRNLLQKEKNLWTNTSGGEALSVVAHENERAEAEFVASRIKEYLSEGSHPHDLVVLYRTNAQSRVLEEALLARSIPYKIIGGFRFYERKEVKDILAYLRFLLNPNDLISLKRIINVPARGIGKQAFLQYLAARGTSGIRRPNKTTDALEKFDALMRDMKEQSATLAPHFLIEYLLKKIAYKEYLEELSPNADERWENVTELISLARRYENEKPSDGLEKLLEDVALMSDTDRIKTGESAVHLMTIHAAKGLEFSTVFLVGMEEGIFPHTRSLFSPAELEEERRLCYVALTRAKKTVYLSFALRRTLFGATQANPPSRFLSEIPEHLVRVEEGIEEIMID